MLTNGKLMKDVEWRSVKVWLTYGDSEKDWKTHEIAMKNGNFINDFLVKACSIIVSKVKSQSMAGRGDFSKMCFFFSRYIDFFSCFYAGGKMLIFWDVIFFGFAKVCFKKQQKKILHSKVKELLSKFFFKSWKFFGCSFVQTWNPEDSGHDFSWRLRIWKPFGNIVEEWL